MWDCIAPHNTAETFTYSMSPTHNPNVMWYLPCNTKPSTKTIVWKVLIQCSFKQHVNYIQQHATLTSFIFSSPANLVPFCLNWLTLEFRFVTFSSSELNLPSKSETQNNFVNLYMYLKCYYSNYYGRYCKITTTWPRI